MTRSTIKTGKKCKKEKKAKLNLIPQLHSVLAWKRFIQGVLRDALMLYACVRATSNLFFVRICSRASRHFRCGNPVTFSITAGATLIDDASIVALEVSESQALTVYDRISNGALFLRFFLSSLVSISVTLSEWINAILFVKSAKLKQEQNNPPYVIPRSDS